LEIKRSSILAVVRLFVLFGGKEVFYIGCCLRLFVLFGGKEVFYIGCCLRLFVLFGGKEVDYFGYLLRLFVVMRITLGEEMYCFGYALKFCSCEDNFG
jgi:hypothetical protein